MRRRLVLVSAAITSMVALAFLFPLSSLIGQLAHDRAMNNAERDAQLLASAVAFLVPGERDEVGRLVGTVPFADGRETTVVFPDGSSVGVPLDGDSLIESARNLNKTSRFDVEGGEVLFVPVSEGGGRTTLVRVFVPDSLLSANVSSARTVLFVLGVVLVGIAVLVADRLARSITSPVSDLADGAHRLAEGDLDTRVEPDGPSEIEEVGRAFNRMAEQVGRLLEVERESVADLSHRLRTPLTALRLDIDAIGDPGAAERLREDVDELERTVDHVIQEARRPMRRGGGMVANIGDVVEDRVRFWGALADEQQRSWSISIPPGERLVEGSPVDYAAALDALLANVFAHTADGVGFSVRLGDGRGVVVLEVADEGEGFGEEAVERGWSGGESSGLGLDIVRRTVEDAGGSMSIVGGGGGVVRLELPLAEDLP